MAGVVLEVEGVCLALVIVTVAGCVKEVLKAGDGCLAGVTLEVEGVCLALGVVAGGDCLKEVLKAEDGFLPAVALQLGDVFLTLVEAAEDGPFVFVEGA